jgi:exosortase A-associated hydrolase 1
MTEVPVLFECDHHSLLGILHEAQGRELGVVIVVGGPQYRVGSHRQFVLLARNLADAGYPVFRFDCRGMGDSSGDVPGFEYLDADIAAAVDTFCQRVPGLSAVILWGLCDAASAALMYAPRDPRVAGLALANPWVRSEATLARAHVRHYYGARVAEAAFWKKLFSGNLHLGRTAREFARNLWTSLSGLAAVKAGGPGSFVDRMADGLRNFKRPILILLSGNDLTAAEFEELAHSAWRPLLQRPGVSWHRLPAANHTFSTEAWRDEVSRETTRWLRSLRAATPQHG